MPSIFLSRASSAMCSISRALFTWYGISVTMMASRRCLRFLDLVRARIEGGRGPSVGGGNFAGAVDDAGGREIRARARAA